MRPLTDEARSVCLLATSMSRAKWLNRSRCDLGYRLGWAQGIMCYVRVPTPDPP